MVVTFIIINLANNAFILKVRRRKKCYSPFMPQCHRHEFNKGKEVN